MKADKKEITRLLKTARGQIDGIIKMVEEDRYCVDISHQLMATEAIINTANRKVLTEHLKSCVRNAKTDKEKDEKIEEMTALITKLIR
ncbi:MAG: metal-sensing transcriptional repressor [Clostridiales bacterium]|nr:metal-sensing transcriptional repressor [Clostridiales bacterium]